MDIIKLLGFKDFLNEDKVWVTIYEDKADNRVFGTLQDAVNSEGNGEREVKQILARALDEYVNPIVAQKWKK